MEAFHSQIEWVPVLVSFVLTFGLGWLWYSPRMFYKQWMKGKGKPAWSPPMWMPMSAQAGSTLILAIVINVLMGYGDIIMTILVGITVAGFVKANGYYSGKTMWAVSVEAGYVVAMVLLMIAINALM